MKKQKYKITANDNFEQIKTKKTSAATFVVSLHNDNNNNNKKIADMTSWCWMLSLLLLVMLLLPLLTIRKINKKTLKIFSSTLFVCVLENTYSFWENELNT